MYLPWTVSEILSLIYQQLKRPQVACNFNSLIETEGLLKVAGSHVNRKSGNISDTVQDRDAITTDH